MTDVRYTFRPHEKDPQWAEHLVEAMRGEPHLFAYTPEAMRGVAEQERFLIAYDADSGTIVGCAALWLLDLTCTPVWLEFGTIYIRPTYRYRASGLPIADEIYRRLLEPFRDANILATTTNRACFRAGERAGLVCVRFCDLPPAIRRATCFCPAAKTGAEDYKACRLADRTCVVRLTPQTYDRLGRPATLALPF